MAKVFSIISQQTPSMGTFAKVGSGSAASIGVGTPTKAVDATAASPWLGTVAIMADGNGTTSQKFTGIAKGVSTDTASATGTVELWQPLPGIIYSGFAKTSTTADSAAEILALRGKRVVFDLDGSGNWTVEAEAADAQVNCVTLLGEGDPTTATLSFVYKPSGTYLDFVISA